MSAAANVGCCKHGQLQTCAAACKRGEAARTGKLQAWGSCKDGEPARTGKLQGRGNCKCWAPVRPGKGGQTDSTPPATYRPSKGCCRHFERGSCHLTLPVAGLYLSAFPKAPQHVCNEHRGCVGGAVCAGFSWMGVWMCWSQVCGCVGHRRAGTPGGAAAFCTCLGLCTSTDVGCIQHGAPASALHGVRARPGFAAAWR
eukprot:361777-Chlamydomonas_euryale.AAC.3